MYKNMDVAVNLFNHTKGSVGIVIDSDLDGACSAAIAYMLCIENGLEDIHIYSHAGKEHGLSDLSSQIAADVCIDIRRIISSIWIDYNSVFVLFFNDMMV